MRIESQRNFDRGETRFARSSAECCNPKRLQNGAKSFELSNISRKNTNFGAVRITAKKPKNVRNLGKLQNEEIFEKVNLSYRASHLISQAAAQFDQKLMLGKDSKGISWNILTKEGSEVEKTVLQRLSDAFKVIGLNKKLNVEVMPDKQVNEAINAFDKEVGRGKTIHFPRKSFLNESVQRV